MLNTELNSLLYYPGWKQYARLAVICGCFAILAYANSLLSNWFIISIIAWFQGFLLSCLLIAAHDCAHNTFLRNHKINRAIGVIISSPLLVNFSLYRYLHMVHHRLANYPGDTQRPRTFTSAWQYFIALFHIKFPYRFIELSLKTLFGRYHEYLITNRQKKDVRLDSIIYILTLIGLTILTLCFPLIMLKFYWLPILFYLMMVFFFTTAEHTGCDVSKDGMKNARSVLSGPIFRFFFWQFNYHAEHHAYPNVPSPNLHKVHQHVNKDIKYTASCYTKLHLHFLLSICRHAKKHR